MSKSQNITLSRRKAKMDFKVSLIFVIPATFFMALYIFYPIIDSIYISFTKWNGITAGKQFIGISNWKTLLADDKFWKAFINNTKIMIMSLAIQMPFALLLATILSIIGKKGKLLKTMWFVPNLMSSVAVGFLFKYAFSTTDGIFTTISMALGHGRVDLLGNSTWALPTVVLVICWQYIPFYMVYYMASYSGISGELYEAAVIDGASKPDYFFRIALPLLKPSIRNACILSMVGSLKYFDLIYVMTNGGPGNATELMATYMYKLSFKQFNLSYGSTVAVGMLIVITLFASVVMKVFRGKETD
ncbi:ABC transporter permease subunit [Blautia glucerasea]|uniref:Lactose transport system permease protein LacF n=2 Tax=Lachnospiraceae TaxID=186803 RepID=A0A6N2UVE1_9FIRM